MQVKSIIQASANIVKITELVKGNIVKLAEENSYDTNISYAVVMDILNDGDKVFIEFLKYKKNYSGVDLEQKVISGEKDVHIFPATPEDLTQHVKSIEQAIREEISNEREEADKKENALNVLLDMVAKQQVSATKYEELGA